jgi:hypothetical protein
MRPGTAFISASTNPYIPRAIRFDGRDVSNELLLCTVGIVSMAKKITKDVDAHAAEVALETRRGDADRSSSWCWWRNFRRVCVPAQIRGGPCSCFRRRSLGGAPRELARQWRQLIPTHSPEVSSAFDRLGFCRCRGWLLLLVAQWHALPLFRSPVSFA